MNSNSERAHEQTPATPCIKVCRLDDQGLCVGCRRTMDEIGRWGVMSPAEREYLMREVLPKRETSR